MARRFWKVGTTSGNNGCPTLYTEPGSDTYVVQGDPVTDPAELAQLDLADGEAAVTVPRELLANFGPKEPVHAPQTISFDEFDGMFTTLKYSAWRLETRRRYAWDEQQDTYHRFLEHGRVDWDLDDPWCQERREQAALGKAFQRVRILDEPPTEGQRYLLDNARRNSAVGETIRVLARSKADELHLPREDFWLFDARVVALLHFDQDDEMTGVELITDPVEVLRYAQAREAAWHHAVPYDQAPGNLPM
ncbi:DUF6879 family protein [Streptomyces thermodiastaticus]|uniref:DUF6879 family protein n=1 Tax=Streptomyces thermodiastaticus TaxID=44061 RepID=UPI00167A9861|nr:DUF6879 family protein [Streptomyces thermodiastaticus]MCE7550915.1 hypothetical protein [Streptomyces thermodiastaticus]GHF73856.1 hypothetical protein GCM10018787_23170 [Streptomyces thermodiastaticus]